MFAQSKTLRARPSSFQFAAWFQEASNTQDLEQRLLCKNGNKVGTQMLCGILFH
jgi:hypothetical protein